MDTKYIIGIIAVVIIILGAFMVFNSGSAKTINVVGSTSVQPVAEKLAEAYMKENPNVKINVQGGGSSVGITSAQQGTAQIGTSSKKLKANESKGLSEFTIGNDGICVVVNTKNNVNGLTKEQLRDIFSGKITNWNQVGGADAKINVITREDGSGTRSGFEDMVMKADNGSKVKILKTAIVQSSTEAVKQAVAQDPNAIGFISLANLDSAVKTLQVDGVAPSEQTVSDGKYPLSRPFLFLTKGTPTGETKAFIDWVLSPAGQAIVKSEKVVPVS
jgi:phosphate transport system substrate-binding protein